MPPNIEAFTYTSPEGLLLMGDHAGHLGAPSVVLLHGIGQTRYSWRAAQLALVAQGYYVVTYDARGHGESAWAADSAYYNFASLSNDLLAIVATLPNRPAVIGASMGGLTAMYALGTSPDFAAALVLVDIVPRPEKTGADRVFSFMRANPRGFANVAEAAAAIALYNPNRPAPKRLSGLAKNLRASADGRLQWHWDPKFVEKMWKDEMHAPDQLLSNCRHFSNPALLVRGMKSDIVSNRSVDELRSSLPQLEVFDVTAAGHMIAGDKNDMFNFAIIEFLRRYWPN